MSDEATAENLLALLEGYNKEFDERCIDRHQLGAEKYGPLKFMGADTLEEAMQEVVDLSNYARYTYVKLAVLRDKLPAMIGEMDEARSYSAETSPAGDADNGVPSPAAAPLE